jgi:hypothetical protein
MCSRHRLPGDPVLAEDFCINTKTTKVNSYYISTTQSNDTARSQSAWLNSWYEMGQGNVGVTFLFQQVTELKRYFVHCSRKLDKCPTNFCVGQTFVLP